VDLVGLPDVLKKDKKIVAPAPAEPEKVAKQLKEAENTAKKIKKAEAARPDEVGLKRKATQEKQREKRIQNALDRIKALAKLQVIKGNQVSHGHSVSADAKESSDPNYLDDLRQHLQDHWALPIWLARQNLSAQVQVFIDSRGRLRDFKFLKTSGNPRFDAEVKKTLTASQPFPPPPGKGDFLSNGVVVGFPL
jgi:TonB family protein